ncbi:MAG: 50S ribosomal protein L4 [Candidatus Micrarchaeia archaeon]
MAKANLYSSDGKKSGEVQLPSFFSESVNPVLIARAAISDQTHFYQPKSPDPLAGIKTSAKYRGRKDDFGSLKNHGQAMLPREVLANGRAGRVRRIPSSVKGRRAHPPKIEKKLIEKVNKKEYLKALHSAMAATAISDFVSKRGHKVPSDISLPIVLDEKAELISKSKDALKMLLAIGIGADLARGQKAKKRSGVGSRKGGKRRPKSLLVIVENMKSPIAKAARNLPGVDVRTACCVSVIDLAPGTVAGRLTAYTKSALVALEKR